MPMKLLCPYCGHPEEKPDRCSACGGLFEPLSRLATQIAMGPWFLRNERKPFMPGFSYEILLAQVRSGRIKPETVLRGPTTHQLWTYASQAPGVSHLLGFCHHCGARAEAADAACTRCGAPFLAVQDRNRFGLPPTAPSEAARQRLLINDRLCPCCGDSLKSPESCGACGTIYSPAAAVGRVHVGPWQLRDSASVFLTGVSLDQLRQMAADGTLNAQSVLRGPGTSQFWSLAGRTRGVARLLGHCHLCQQKVQPQQKACAYCGQELACPMGPDELGLMLPTQADVASAQTRLEETQQRLAKALAAGGQEAWEKALRDEPLVQEVEKKFICCLVDDASIAPAPAAAVSPMALAPSLVPGPAGALSVVPLPVPAFVQAVAGAAPVPLAGTAPVAREEPTVDSIHIPDIIPMALPRRRIARSGNLFKWAVAAMVILTGVGVAIMISSSLPSSDGVHPRMKGPPKAVLPASEFQISQKQDVDKAWDRLGAMTATARFKPLIEEARAKIGSYRLLWDAGKFASAELAYQEVAGALEQVDDLLKMKEEVLKTRRLSEEAAQTAKAVEAPTRAKINWTQGIRLSTEAAGQNESEKFEAADRTYLAAMGSYEQSRIQAELAGEVVKALAAFEKDLTSGFPRQQVQALGGDAWQRVEALLKEADQAAGAEQYSDALKIIESARPYLPEIEKALIRVVGVHFWAIRAGYLTTDFLLEVAGGRPPLPEVRTSLVEVYGELGLEEMVSKVPSGETPPAYKDAAKTLVVDAAMALEKQRGGPIRRSFHIGLQVRLVERLLRSEASKDASELLASVKAIEAEAVAAQYPAAFLAILKEFTTKMQAKPRYEGLKKGRKIWTDLAQRMSKFESAATLIPGTGRTPDPTTASADKPMEPDGVKPPKPPSATAKPPVPATTAANPPKPDTPASEPPGSAGKGAGFFGIRTGDGASTDTREIAKLLQNRLDEALDDVDDGKLEDALEKLKGIKADMVEGVTAKGLDETIEAVEKMIAKKKER